MEEKNKKEDVKLNNVVKLKKKTIFLIISIILFICLIVSTIFAIINMWNDKVMKGVEIEGIDVSNYNKDELKEKLSNLVSENNSKNIILKYNDNETTITPESLNTTYNIDETVEQAYSVGRKGNIFINNFEILKTYLLKNNIEIKEEIDNDKLDANCNSLNENLPGVVEESDYYIEDSNLIITKGKEGIKVNNEQLKEKLKETIDNYSSSYVTIDIPVDDVQPEKIDLEKIHTEIYKEAQDAYISKDPLTVHPNVNGVDFAISIDDAKKILEEDKEEYTIPLKITKANKTLNDLGEEAFPDKLGSFYTKYDVSNENRANNIKLASNKINGTIILPGETFSYNQIVGKRTIESGYKEAGAYLGGQIVQEVGGGICQVSSTLYNAALYANLQIVERYNHCFESSYVDAGRDATVSWGTVDFKFKNNRTYPIKIVATSKNGVETVSIYGIPEETEYEIVIQSKKTSTIERTVKYEDDDTLESGKEVISQTGHDGCTSETYKIVRLNGKTISNTIISKDTYKALEKIIKRGTKSTETITEENNSEPEKKEIEDINMNSTNII